ncbi:MAG: hypothetical protein KY468_06335 [Armatimonadetes bacterium]|nr:hypothetical protein [Armatimonadota bacterium]
MTLRTICLMGLLSLGFPLRSAGAAPLPHPSQTTTLTAYVSEQALVQIPSSAPLEASSSDFRGSPRLKELLPTAHEMALEAPLSFRIALNAARWDLYLSASMAPLARHRSLGFGDSWIHEFSRANRLDGEAFLEVATTLEDGISASSPPASFNFPRSPFDSLDSAPPRITWKIEYIGL